MCDRVCFFFFKQKTAYEMRLSDGSSDVCSSDLVRVLVNAVAPFGVLFVLAEHAEVAPAGGGALSVLGHGDRRLERDPFVELAVDQPFLPTVEALHIGRASCRERVWQFVYILVAV